MSSNYVFQPTLAINRMWPVRKKPFLPEECAEWQFQTYAWLLRNFEGYERFRNTSLITPTAEFFPATDLIRPRLLRVRGQRRSLHEGNS